jgi:hypothetical protein
MRTSRLIAIAGLALFGLSNQASAATFTFDLNNSYASNENASVVLTPLGGTLGATGYTFAANQGLSLPSADIGTTYSIEIGFNFTTTSGFRKILDYNNRTLDTGLYNLSSTLDFFNNAGGATAGITPGTNVIVDLTRDATGTVRGYLNGALQFTYDDSTLQQAVVTAAALQFFVDDAATGFGEASGGFVDYIKISDSPNISAVPLPAALPLFATGLGALGLLGWRRKRKAAAVAA